MKSIKPIIIIPSRLAAKRLPNKPLLLINNEPMVIQILNRALEADIAEVLVACGDKEIFELVKENSGNAILTDPTLPSGTDRVYAALTAFDTQQKYNLIINLQGDLPNIDSQNIKTCFATLVNNYQIFDITTIGAEITDMTERENPNVVKAIVSFQHTLNTNTQTLQNTHLTTKINNILTNNSLPQAVRTGRALYFTRSTAPWGEGELYHHIGVYAYTREVLTTFVNLPPSPLEKREKLEQLRALEHNLTIGFSVVDSIPISVDTKKDLQKANDFFKTRN